jgi:hypothetical protein
MNMIRQSILMLVSTALAIGATLASATPLPDATDDTFCTAVQEILAGTTVPSEPTVYPDIASFRQSKPTPRPLTTSQVVTLDEQGRPKMVSCKVKSADHIRAEYGEDAAGPQRYCREITVMVHAEVVAKLEAEEPELAATVRGYVIEPDEPYNTGRMYLSDFPLAFADGDGNLHINTQSLQVNWDDWHYWIMPNVLRGQTYCHLITPEHLEALARGQAQPDPLPPVTEPNQGI